MKLCQLRCKQLAHLKVFHKGWYNEFPTALKPINKTTDNEGRLVARVNMDSVGRSIDAWLQSSFDVFILNKLKNRFTLFQPH